MNVMQTIAQTTRALDTAANAMPAVHNGLRAGGYSGRVVALESAGVAHMALADAAAGIAQLRTANLQGTKGAYASTLLGHADAIVDTVRQNLDNAVRSISGGAEAFQMQPTLQRIVNEASGASADVTVVRKVLYGH